MFTGIIEEAGKVASFHSGKLVITAGDILRKLDTGSSIAVNGVCLTVTGMTPSSFSVDVMPETSGRSNIELLDAGDKVNLESPLPLGGPVGGHLVQGHIDATGRVAAVKWDGKAMIMKFEAPPEVMRYIVEKGFISVDGASLTVTARDTGSFQVSIVEYTRQHTTLGEKRVGDLVNLEADIIGKYVEQFSRAPGTGVTTEFLQEHGFLVS